MSDTVGKRVQFDPETWHAIDLLSKDSMKSFQELADEAFRDLLRKRGVPANLREALKRSAHANANPVPPARPQRRRPRANGHKPRR
jgi:hypothetical protein